MQNRVDPFGELFAARVRGTLFGNRGGRFHRDDRTLGSRRQVSKAWICCVLSFKGRQRDVWGRYYTELFFLDEPTALAAGHRPCFECRRAEAIAFAERFPIQLPGRLPGPSSGRAGRAAAPEMDRVLDRERRPAGGNGKRVHRVALDDVPDGGIVTLDGEAAFAVKGGRLLRWTPAGYAEAVPRPRARDAGMLTPPSIARVLARGFEPRWHPSAASL